MEDEEGPDRDVGEVGPVENLWGGSRGRGGELSMNRKWWSQMVLCGKAVPGASRGAKAAQMMKKSTEPPKLQI